MNSAIYLAMRRMRAPLLALLATYAISMIGMVLMPGVDAQGRPWHMSFFHAFYFLSYTATTIGFGETPYPFSDAQRLWAIVSIYLTVVSWLYAIGKILTLLQDPAFRQVVRSARFAHSVRRLSEPFYLVCGYGETGSLLVESLDHLGCRSVVIDINLDRINELDLQDYQNYVPGLCADACPPEHLTDAGITHPRCAGVIALTNDDNANLSVAIAAKLLNPNIMVIARAESQGVMTNMASFGTDHIINPFERFGEHLALAINTPTLYLLYEWITGVPDTPLMLPLYPPRGNWILCGYGRFGKAVARNITHKAITPTLIEADPTLTDCQDCIVGAGTDGDTLTAAGVKHAACIVAGTNDDITNLSIVMTARELNPELFVVLRKNLRRNDPLFNAFGADFTMQPSNILAHECLAILTTPLLSRFLALCRVQDNDWGNQLISRLSAVIGETTPDNWDVHITPVRAPAICRQLIRKKQVRIKQLLCDPANRLDILATLPLLLVRKQRVMLLPDDDTTLKKGDQILFCGDAEAARRQVLTLYNDNALSYVLFGREAPGGSVWRWVERRRDNA